MRKLFGICLMVFSTISLAENTEWRLSFHDINRVYDGDTFMIDLKGLPSVFGNDLSIRVRDVDTPEMRSRCSGTDQLTKDEHRANERAMAAVVHAYVETWLSQAKEIRVHNVSRDSFFRLIADVSVDGVDYRTHLLEKGYGHNALDGDIGGWCADPQVLQFSLSDHN